MNEVKSKKKPYHYFLLLSLTCLSLGGFGWVIYQLTSDAGVEELASVPPEKKFMIAWRRDIKHMGDARSLPKGFNDLKAVEFISTSGKLKQMIKKYPMSEFQTHKDGHYTLEILLDQLKGGGLMMQYDLVDVRTGNTVWERGRTFPQNF
jgi:hypothetical protein